MKSKTILALVMSVGLAAAIAVAQEATPAAAGPAAIQVTAKKYEFDPAVIKVNQGDHVKLVIRAVDHVHGFKLADFNVNQRLEKGVPTTVEFTADRAGTFPFECSVVCGLGHHKMKGQLVVEPSSTVGTPPSQ